MKRALITGIASLLAVALIAPAAQAATEVRQAQVEFAARPALPPEGAMTLDFIFKNQRANKKRFTPRALTRIAFSKIYLTCSDHMTFTSQLFLTDTFETEVKLKKVPHPHPKPGRYAFRFAYSFPAFSGTLTGTIDKVNTSNVQQGPRFPRAHGSLVIEDLDADPGHPNCATSGPLGWSDLSLTTL